MTGGDSSHADVDADDIRRLVETQVHEFDANLNYNDHGLRPWFACDRVVKDGGGSKEANFEFDDHRWAVKIYYTDSNLLSPGTTPAGTTIDHGNVREFRIEAKQLDDTERRRFSAHVRPRWKGQRAETNDGRTVTINVPDQLANSRTDAVNVRFQSSYIEPTDVLDVLCRAADALDINARYFESPERDLSPVNDHARYVRVREGQSGAIHARDGPLAAMGHLLENDRSGFRKVVQDDTDERNRGKAGFYHTTTLGERRIREIWPTHSFPREMKHYYIDDYHDRNKSDPLRHPKLEVSYQTSKWDKSLAFTGRDLDALREQTDETIYAVLADAGLDVRAGPTFVEDDYFANENATTTATVVDLPLSEIKHEQESIVFKHLAGGLSPVEEETFETLMADGGEVAPAEIADENDRNLDSVYRALGRLDDLLDREYGSVTLKNEHIAELVYDAIRQAKAAGKTALETTAKVKEAADRGFERETQAFVAWATNNIENHHRHDDELTLDLGEFDERPDFHEIRNLLREGYRHWVDAHQNPEPFRMGSFRLKWHDGIQYQSEGGYVSKYLE